MSTTLHYDKIKDDWMDALPLGNGRVGAMFFGLPGKERIEMNEESLWSGKPLEEEYVSDEDALSKLRKYLFDEDYEAANKYADKNFLANPPRVRFYETFGNIFIDFDDKNEADNYYKFLDLSTAIAGADYKKSGSLYKTRCFISEEYDVLVYKAQSDGKPFDCTLSICREKDEAVTNCGDNAILMSGMVSFETEEIYGDGGLGMSFVSVLKVKTDGKACASDGAIRICGATYIEVFGAFETNYDAKIFDYRKDLDITSIAEEKCERAMDFGYAALEERHKEDHSRLFDKVSLSIECEDKSHIPTDLRLMQVQKGEDDPGLAVLYYNFGRYLLIESSAKNATLPANLQGIWVNGFRPPWGSDYHTNINLQMNYWPSDIANMQEAFPVYLDFVKNLSLRGYDTAKKLYGTRGWTVHHTTDIFGRSGVHDSVSCGFFPMAGPWLCLNLWEHFEFTCDLSYLEEIYPILKGSCEFLLDFLVESPDGYLVTNPSNSPENSFFYYDKDGSKKQTMFTYGATIDFELIDCIFTRMIAACSILGRDNDFAKHLSDALKRLPPIEISERYGTIREWIKDYEEVEPSHRHVSHLFALHPSDTINENTPELFEAAKRTIHRRLSHGGGATGWSRAWIINFYARLKDGNSARENLLTLLKNSTAYNLFDMHPPFQIDGNFGAVSGITEMLIQSHLGKIGQRVTEILPALPDAWKKGSVKGIKGRGNFEFDIIWDNNKPTAVTVKACCTGTLRLKLSDNMQSFKTQKQYRLSGNILEIDFAENEVAEIVF